MLIQISTFIANELGDLAENYIRTYECVNEVCKC